MLEDGELADDEGNFASGQLLNQEIAMSVLAIKHSEVFPGASGLMEALQFVGNPEGFVFRGIVLDDADLFAGRLVRLENFLRKFRTDLVEADNVGGDAENVGSGAIVFGEGDAEGGGVLAFAPAGEIGEEQFEAAERGAAKTVDGLIVVADYDDVAGISGEQAEQFELGDVGVLEFVYEDVAEAFLKAAETIGIALEEGDGLRDEAVDSDSAFFAEDFFAGAVGAGDLALQSDMLGALVAGVFVEMGAIGFEFGGEGLGKLVIIVAGDELVLAAREKLDEVAEKLAGLGKASIFFEFKAAQIAAQQNPVVDVFEGQAVGIDFLEQSFAERVKGGEDDIFAAFADGFHDAGLHFSGGFLGEGQAKDVFPKQGRVGFQKVANAFGDDASFAGASAGNDQQRAGAVSDGAVLRVVGNQAGTGGFGEGRDVE